MKVISKVIRVLASQNIVAPHSDTVINQLRKKHPEEQESPNFPPPPFADITMKEIENAIRSFPNGSSGGFDGLQPQHLKDMMNGTSEQSINNFLTTMSQLLTLGLKGLIPESVCSVLYGARLIALQKPDDGLRPIAVGNVLRRILR